MRVSTDRSTRLKVRPKPTASMNSSQVGAGANKNLVASSSQNVISLSLERAASITPSIAYPSRDDGFIAGAPVAAAHCFAVAGFEAGATIVPHDHVPAR
jgi:hypothetical protein